MHFRIRTPCPRRSTLGSWNRLEPIILNQRQQLQRSPLRAFFPAFPSRRRRARISFGLSGRTGGGSMSCASRQFGGEFLQRDQFVVLDILLLVLRESVNEDSPRAGPEHNQRSKSAGLALACARDPLFDDSTAEISGDQTSFCIPHRPAQRSLGDTGLVRKARERLGFESSHR